MCSEINELKTSINSEVLLSSLNTFTENENHKQKLFIQFFLGVIVVIIGYSIVYSDTESDAKIWELKREGLIYTITSYSISALIGAYVIAQSVLILLARIIVSGGYNFRKYQMIAVKVRKIGLQNSYEELYGKTDNGFSPYDKNGSFSSKSYLPEFDTIFFVCIWLLQVLLFLSFIFKLGTFNNETLVTIIKPLPIFESGNIKLSLVSPWVILLSLTPLFLTALLQKNYYFKYLNYVKRARPIFNHNFLKKAFSQQELVIKYKRSISLTWGYLLLFLLFQFLSFCLFFISERYFQSHFNNDNLKIEDYYNNHIVSLDFILLTTLSLFLWYCFWWNLIKSFFSMKKYIRFLHPNAKKLNLKSIIIYEIERGILSRNEVRKKYRTITPILILFSILLILSTLVTNIFICDCIYFINKIYIALFYSVYFSPLLIYYNKNKGFTKYIKNLEKWQQIH